MKTGFTVIIVSLLLLMCALIVIGAPTSAGHQEKSKSRGKRAYTDDIMLENNAGVIDALSAAVRPPRLQPPPQPRPGKSIDYDRNLGLLP